MDQLGIGKGTYYGGDPTTTQKDHLIDGLGAQKNRLTNDLRKLVMDCCGHVDWPRVATTLVWDDLQDTYVQQ